MKEFIAALDDEYEEKCSALVDAAIAVLPLYGVPTEAQANFRAAYKTVFQAGAAAALKCSGALV